MGHHVFLEEVVVAELLAASIDRATDCRRPGVSLCVKRQTGCIQEAFVALITLERFVGEMGLDMDHQRVGLGETFIALVALVRSFA